MGLRRWWCYYSSIYWWPPISLSILTIPSSYLTSSFYWFYWRLNWSCWIYYPDLCYYCYYIFPRSSPWSYYGYSSRDPQCSSLGVIPWVDYDRWSSPLDWSWIAHYVIIIIPPPIISTLIIIPFIDYSLSPHRHWIIIISFLIHPIIISILIIPHFGGWNLFRCIIFLTRYSFSSLIIIPPHSIFRPSLIIIISPPIIIPSPILSPLISSIQSVIFYSTVIY